MAFADKSASRGNATFQDFANPAHQFRDTSAGFAGNSKAFDTSDSVCFSDNYKIVAFRCQSLHGGAIRQKQPQVGGLRPGKRPVNSRLLQSVVGFAKASGVKERDGKTGNLHPNFDDVPSRARDFGRDRGFTPGKLVQQRGLASIGRADNRDFKTVTDPFSGLNASGLAVKLGGKAVDEGKDFGRDVDGNVFIGKVDSGLQKRPCPDQVTPPGFNLLPDRAGEDTDGLTPLRFGFSVDQVGKALDLGKVKDTVFKGATGEFAWLGQTETRLHGKRP